MADGKIARKNRQHASHMTDQVNDYIVNGDPTKLISGAKNLLRNRF